MRLLLSLLAVSMTFVAVVTAAQGQAYPNRPIRLIVPFPPGGSNDIVGRYIAAQLTERLGRQVVVDNRGGAGGTIGTEIAARAAADGYTLLVISAAYAFSPSLYKKLGYDPAKAFAPVGKLGSGAVVMAVFPGYPAKSVQDIIAIAKERPGELQYATAGVGSFQHLAYELFRLGAGIRLLHVPYKGGAPAMLDVIAGNVPLTMGTIVQMLPHVRSNRLRALGTSGLKRAPVLPDVPTIAESGVPGYEANNWWGVLAPTGTPAAIIGRLDREIAASLQAAETQKRFQAEGAEAQRMGPAEFWKFIGAETVKWARVMKEAGVVAQ